MALNKAQGQGIRNFKISKKELQNMAHS